MDKNKKVVVIGGGIAGMESSTYLTGIGYDVTLIEKTDKLGGRVLEWEQLFPTRRLGKEVVDYLIKGIDSEKVKVKYNTDIDNIKSNDKRFLITLSDNSVLEADSILVTTGYDLFDARKKEEYGYGIYNNVVTSAELEEIFLKGGELKAPDGKIPKRVGLVYCVGSRDAKVGNIYCSKVCCVTGVKQAIEIKEKLPDTEVFCFYMDLRMYGTQFEELYKESQEKWGVNYIRGRLSEASENANGSIKIKAEDTLAGRPIKMDVDMLVLMVGFVPSEGTKKIGKLLNLEFRENGFIKPMDPHTMNNVSSVQGVFLAGTCTAARTINNTIMDARSAAAKVVSYLENFKSEKRNII